MKFTLKFNPENTGLKTLFREWQITTLRLLWERPLTPDSPRRKVWMHVRDTVEAEAASLGISYKLVKIEGCAQVHRDP